MFLDEIGALPIELQPKLLRVLQEGQFLALGSRKEVRSTAMVIAATNADLVREVNAGRFRADLYHRLNVLRIEVPPLRERREDIPVLLEHFVREGSQATGRSVPTIEPRARAALCAHAWPGNVRQLANAAFRAVVFTKGNMLTLESFGLDGGGADDGFPLPWEAYASLPFAKAKASLSRDFTRFYLARALRAASGNVAHAAKAVGMDASNFWRAMRQAGIERNDF